MLSRRRRPRAVQTELRFERKWGGKRDGAGRPKTGKKYVPHRPRPAHKKAHPVHVTLRAVVATLRDFPVFEAVASALANGSKDFFRVCEYSVQRNHIHLIVEADDRVALARGMQGLAARIAKAVNRTVHRRGSVFADHYHAHALRTPNEVRNALVYVLSNWKKHLPGANRGVDGCSSAVWFDGWRGKVPDTISPLAAARSWLLTVGWRRRGLLRPTEVPRAQFTFA
jgi:REP element-mobilizing transposase RayT